MINRFKHLAFLPLLLAPALAFACGGPTQQVYTGEIRYQVNPNFALYVTAIVTLDFEIDELLVNDSILLNWGDGTSSYIYANKVEPDSTANKHWGYTRFYRHSYAGKHAYAAAPDSGYYIISLGGQYRLNYLNNIDTGQLTGVPYYLQALVSLNADDVAEGINNTAPITQTPVIGYADYLHPFDNNWFINDPDGDSIAFSFITPQVAMDDSVLHYQYPNNYCAVTNSTLSINNQNGEVVWNNPCSQGVFTIATTASKYRSGRLMGTMMRDEIVYVTADAPNGISEVSDNSAIKIYPNPALNVLNIENNTEEIINQVAVSDMSGKCLLVESHLSDNQLKINTQGITPGIYFIRLHSCDGSITTKRFVKQ